MSLEKIEVIVVKEDHGRPSRALEQRLTGPDAQSAGFALRVASRPTGGHRDPRLGLGRNDRR